MTRPDFIHAKISVAEVDNLRADIEQLRDANNRLDAQSGELVQTNHRVMTENARLKTLLTECVEVLGGTLPFVQRVARHDCRAPEEYPEYVKACAARAAAKEAPLSDGPFKSATFNRADAARNAALRNNANDHIGALGAAFDVVRRLTREATLREAAEIARTLTPVAAECLGGMPAQFRLGHATAREESEAAIRALLSATPEPDPTVALAKLFKRMWDGEAGRAPKPTIEAMIALGLIEVAPTTGFISVTPLGKAALALAEGGG